MAYQLGRLLHQELGYQVYILTDGSSDRREDKRPSPFLYDPLLPCRSLSGAVQRLKPEDVLICNPSYSGHHFGLRAKGFKLMYIQGFTTFHFLDCCFDHYVTVSPFVHDFVKQVYGIETSIIPPFLHDDFLTPRLPLVPWAERKPASLTLNLKGDPALQAILLDRLREEIRRRAPQVEGSFDWDEAIASAQLKVPQPVLSSRLGSSRYFLTLSPAEGFGLVPLEAMALGSTVLGLDGYGGLAFMRPGLNCEVSRYPDLAGLAQSLIRVVQNPDHASALATAGRQTAQEYTYERFRRAWLEELQRVLPL